MTPHDRPQLTGMDRRLLVGTLCAIMAVGGCGGSSITSESSSAKKTPPTEPVPAVSIVVLTPTVLREGERYIPKRYTCNGADDSLPVRWSHIPPAIAELAIFVVNLQPLHGRIFFDWAVVGLGPASHGIAAGRLPAGAVVGRNSFGNVGYSICPSKGTHEEGFVVRVLALPHALTITRGFDPESVYREAERSATAVGLAGGRYQSPRA